MIEYRKIQKILINQDIFTNMSGSGMDADCIYKFEQETGLLSWAWMNPEVTEEEFWDKLEDSTSISQDLKWQIEEYAGQVLLLFELKKLLPTQTQEPDRE